MYNTKLLNKNTLQKISGAYYGAIHTTHSYNTVVAATPEVEHIASNYYKDYAYGRKD